jgi:predicted PurR-regulated permease PerM
MDSEIDEELIREARRIDDTVRLDRPEPQGVRVQIDVPAMTVVKVLAILFAAYIVIDVWPLISLLLVSLMLAAALSPFLALIERRGLGRPWALTCVSLILLLGLAALLALVIPALVTQTQDLITNSDLYVRSLQTILAQHGVHRNLLTLWHSLPQRLGRFDSTLVSVATAVFDSTVALGTVLFVTIYLLSDQERIKTFFVGAFPEEKRPKVLEVLAELRRQVGGYVRGQLITSLLAMVFSFVVMVIAGIPNPIALAVWVGVADLIPMFGQLLGTIPCVLIALTISPVRAVVVLIGFVLYQQAENHVIVPRVYSNTMNVSSLVALVGLLVGAKLLGMLGMLVALPVVAALPVILDFVGVHINPVRPPDTEDLADASHDLGVEPVDTPGVRA